MKVLLLSIALTLSIPSCLVAQIRSPLADTTSVKSEELENRLPDSGLGELGLEKDTRVAKGEVLTKGLKNKLRDKLNPNPGSLGLADSLSFIKKIDWKPKMTYNYCMSFDMARGNSNFISFLSKADVHVESGFFGVNTSIGYNLTHANGQLISNDFLFNVVPAIW